MKPFDKKEKSDCSASDDSPPQRPKRNTCQKSVGLTNGLLWREETDLKKALYASLQENKRKNLEEDEEENLDEEEQNQTSEVIENGVEESPKKAKVHAQRKFAQGSTPNSPVLTPQKVHSANNSTTQLLPYRRPKTEDFLTFLCLRGTSILPPSLDFLNSCSKSDTSSECRSLSPELDDFTSKDASKNFDTKERCNIKSESVENGLPRKIGACKASSKRHPDASPPVKKLNLAGSKSNKEVVSAKRRKLRDENVDPVNSKVSTKAKSTGLNALREKYKKQRLAADKKKLLPTKSSNCNSVSKKLSTNQKSQSSSKPRVLESKNGPQKKPIKTNQPIVPKSKLTKLEKKLAVEKRKSLRSADVRPKRLASLKKKTPWLRRAKLVPPIVDVESDSSEPEIIHTTPIKKSPPQKKESKSNNLCDRLRSKQDPSKVKNRLTRRQLLLKKHIQNRLKAKKSVLHSKNIRSRALIKRTTKQTMLKKVKKNLVIKTMSLRKDLQNKRVTRSAKHQIEEMFWSNPEKRTRIQNQKPEKKKPVTENQSSVSRKPKPTTVTKGKELSKVTKNTKDNLKRKSHSISPNDNKTVKQYHSAKVSEVPSHPAKISRRSLSRDEKSGPSGSSKNVSHQKQNTDCNSSAVEIKSKPSTQIDSKKESKVSNSLGVESNKASVASTSTVSGVTDSKHSKNTDNLKSVSNELNKANSKFSAEKDVSSKLDLKEKEKNDLGSSSNLSDKNVQNNLNLLLPEKASNKDISNLIELNVNCEEPMSLSTDPCCSYTEQVKEKTINKAKDSKPDSMKEVNINQDIKSHKKNHDKKSLKKSAVKEESKLSKRNPDKEKSLKKSDKSDVKSVKKHSSKERRSSKDIDQSDKKNLHKKESTKIKTEKEGEPAEMKKNKSNHDKKSIKLEKTISSDNHDIKSSEKINRKDISKEKSPICKTNKENSEANNSVLPQKKDLYSNASDRNLIDDVFVVKSVDNVSLHSDARKKIDFQQPSCSKDEHRNVINSNSSNVTSRETDDDSDYDLTLDQFIKLNALRASEKSGTSVLSPIKDENSTKISNSENKDFKQTTKDHDKEVKSKKDGESTKHKKEKDSTKSKNHDKDQKTPKKDDKGSKKDPKSLAKLLKKEREKEKIKLSKKEEKSKHKKDGSSSKSSKRDSEKDGSKANRKDLEDSSALSNLGDSSVEHSESKKEKFKKESKLSRSSSCDETKSPKKKKKHNEFKDIEKIKNLISKSSILNEFSGFKEFKRRSSSDKSELKKAKKRKKLALLKDKKLSKKLSSKLLRKYSKKKGLKSKKKLKKKELKEMKIADLENKILSKSKKQKHKLKNDHHHGKDAEKVKNIETSVSVTTSKTVNISSTSETAQFFAKVTESQSVSFTNTTSDAMNSSQTCNSSTTTVPTYILESVPDVIPPLETMSTQISQPISAPAEQYVFSSADELQGIVASDFSGVFDETFPNGAILLATRDTISQVPLHFIQDISVPKTMADAATNTGEDDIEEIVEVPESMKNDEMSVGTQTMTPAGSPSPTVEIQPLMLPPPTEHVRTEKIKPEKSEPTSSVPSISTKVIQEKDVPTDAMPIKSATSNLSNDTASVSPKPKRRSSFVKKSKTQTIVLPEGQPFPVDSAKMVSAPVYYPTAEEFRDPLEYIFKIQNEASQFGICKIVPPSSFKPECKVNDDMRFTAHNQYLHKMLSRWGPNVQHTACIKKHLKSQKVKLEQAPLIGGIELDISRFYHTVQQYGGLQQVIEKKKWQRVADSLRVPKTAQDRVTKLYDAYCKYLVSYDTLPKDEKQKLEKEVNEDHEKRIKLRNSPKDLEKEEEELDDEENTDCVSKGRSMSLSNFFRIARNTMNMWFKNVPSPDEVEHEYWKVVTERQQHVVVHAGNIDSSVYQSGFACNRNSPFAKHPWNLKILTNNSSSILRCMGPVSGVTIPTLHVGMLFTTGCWYRDPHSLPWIEYLHTGASKIWYSIPAKGCEKFRESMKKIMPEYCTNNPIWLPSDTAMVPPDLLIKHGASLSRTIQNSGQFVVIFPESFTSTICCGYCVSESVYFAPTSWLDLAVKAFEDIQSSCEPPSFSLERLLFSIANDPKTQPETLQKILPLIENIRLKERQLRSQLSDLGLKQCERLPVLEIKDKKKKSRIDDECEQECEICRTHCYVSMVVYVQEDTIYCLPHALEHIPKKNLKLCKLTYTYKENELEELETKIKDLISTHLAKLSVKKKSPKKKVLPASEK